MSGINEKTGLETTTGLDFLNKLDSIKGFKLPRYTVGIKLKARFDGVVTLEVEYYPCFNNKQGMVALFKKYELKLIEE